MKKVTTRHSHFSRRSRMSISGIALLLLSSCGVTYVNPYNLPPADATGHTTIAAVTAPALSTDNGQYTCPSSPNVVPSGSNVNPTNAAGTAAFDNFTVCKDTATPSQILIHGSTESSNTLCVYPVLNQTLLYSGSSLMVQCQPITSSGVVINFGTTFDSVIIVESQNESAMTSCLVNGYLASCPQYSIGSL